MQLSLAAAVAVFLTAAPLCSTEPTTDNNPGVLAARAPEGFRLEVRQESVDLDLSDFDIEDVQVDNLDARATVHCSNQGKINRVKPEYKGKCDPANSVGFGSAHNCKDSRSGKSYLCVQSDKATCYTASDAKKRNFENGECFIRK